MQKFNFSIFTLLFALFSTAATAQWTTAALSQSRYAIGATAVGNKAIFAGGSTSYYAMSNRADIYDAAAGTWTVKLLPQARASISAVTLNDRAIFAGGIGKTVSGTFFSNKVDIFNNSTGIWTKKALSQVRVVGAAAVNGGKAVFAGGIRAINPSTFQPTTTNKVDIYDYATNAFSHTVLSTTRTEMAVASVGNKIIFVGGVKNFNADGEPIVSNVIEIYDVAANTWTTSTMANARTGIAAAVVGNKAFFAGGYSWLPTTVYYDNVEIYDATTNTWSTATLSEARANCTPAVTGNLVFFAGGLATSNYSSTVDIYDSATNIWSTANISAPKSGMAVAVTNHRVMFAGGGALGYTAPVEVFDRDNGTWSVEYLSVARVGFAAVSVNNKAVFAGGRATNGFPWYGSAAVDIFQDASPRPAFGTDRSAVLGESLLKIFPNPATDGRVNIGLEKWQGQPVFIQIFNQNGQLVWEKQVEKVETPSETIQIGGLPDGQYWVKIQGPGDEKMTAPLQVLGKN